MESVIVTGAAKGIGRAIVRQLGDAGFRIHACDLSLDGLVCLKEENRSSFLTTHHIDVTDAIALDNLVRRILNDDQDARALVNNAGIYLGKELAQYTLEEIDRVIQVNLRSAVVACRAFGLAVGVRGVSGVIVNISSVAAHGGSSDPVYGAAKAALLGLTKSCALQFAPRIRVNAIAPGLVETGMLQQIPSWRIAHYRRAELLDRPLQADDIAAAVLFLLSDKARGFTGAVLDLNNGCYLR
jgi:3-oxoacyl-[acyl-carrier protein] reductase